MKNLVFLFSLSLFLNSCSKPGEDEIFCTLEIRNFTVTIGNSNGTPVFLERHHTLDKSTGDTILNFNPASQPFCQDSTKACYTYFQDNISLTTERGKTFVFEGMRGDTVLVRQDFVLKHDKCHVIVVSGKESLLIN